jgi:DNA-binding CsgD family transcriptional regulator
LAGARGFNEETALGWILSPDASAVYLRLLQGKPEEVSGDVADELVSRGFAMVDPVDGLLRVLPPEVPIVRAMAASTQSWLDSMPSFDLVQRDLSSLVRADFRHTATAVMTPTQVNELPDRDAKSLAIISAISSARLELCCFQQDIAPGPTDGPEIVFPAPQDLLQRGVAIKFLYERGVLDDTEFLEAALDEVDLGVQARVVERLPSQFTLVDQRLLIMELVGPESVALTTTASAIVASYYELFAMTWDRATPLGSGRTADATLSATHKMVLSHLLAGRSTDSIGRALRIDPRTVRRKLDDLFQHFGVDDRSALIATAMKELRT